MAENFIRLAVTDADLQRLMRLATFETADLTGSINGQEVVIRVSIADEVDADDNEPHDGLPEGTPVHVAGAPGHFLIDAYLPGGLVRVVTLDRVGYGEVSIDQISRVE